MRNILPLCVGLGLALAPQLAAARPWKGITPGKSTRADVEAKFGKPPQVQENQGKCAARLIYNADKKPEGAREAHVCVDAAGKVVEMNVFPDTVLDKSTVEEAFGEEYRKKLTDEFLTYWHYERDGLVVFFEKGNKNVKVILYVEAKPGAKKPPAKEKTPTGGGGDEDGAGE